MSNPHRGSARRVAGDKRPNRRALAPGLALLLLPLWASSGAALQVDVMAGADLQDNLSHSERLADQRADAITTLRATPHAGFLLSPHLHLTLGAGLRHDHPLYYEGLGFFEASSFATLRAQPVLGFSAPWYEISARGAYREHLGSALRDGGLGSIVVQRGQWLTDALEVRGGYALDLRRALRDTVFDLTGHRAFLETDWRISSAWTVHAGFSYRHGDVVSTASPRLDLRDNADARAPDLAFCPTGSCIAYRLPGDTYQGDLGLRIALDGTSAVDVSAGYQEILATGDNAYAGWTVGTVYLHRFR